MVKKNTVSVSPLKQELINDSILESKPVCSNARSSNERIRIYKVVVHQVRIQKCIPFLYTSTVKKWDF